MIENDIERGKCSFVSANIYSNKYYWRDNFFLISVLVYYGGSVMEDFGIRR